MGLKFFRPGLVIFLPQCLHCPEGLSEILQDRNRPEGLDAWTHPARRPATQPAVRRLTCLETKNGPGNRSKSSSGEKEADFSPDLLVDKRGVYSESGCILEGGKRVKERDISLIALCMTYLLKLKKLYYFSFALIKMISSL